RRARGCRPGNGELGRDDRDPARRVADAIDDREDVTPDVLARATQPFFTTVRNGALGLGLTLAAAPPRAARGRLALDSQERRGTRARLTLPLASVASDLTPSP